MLTRNACRIFSLITITYLSFIVIETPLAAAQSFATKAKQVYMVDAQTGMTLYAKDSARKMPTSSMSKVMTIYMVFEALKDGRITMDTKFSISEKAWRKGGSKMFIEVGKKVRVADLVRGVIIQSGNDAAIALAEGLAGTEDAFAEALTKKAKELGMSNSQFRNASGWPDEEHYSTAEDLAMLAYRIKKDFPEYYSIFSEKEFTYNNITQKNRNPLLFKDMNVDGLKTGHTEVGGYGLMASGERNGRRIIMVANGMDSEKDRASESANLMEYGFNGFKNMIVFKKGQLIAELPVWLGKSKTLPLHASKTINISYPALKKEDVRINVEFQTPLKAPINKGEQVAKIKIEIPSMDVKYIPLYSEQHIDKKGFIGSSINKAMLYIFGQRGSE